MIGHIPYSILSFIKKVSSHIVIVNSLLPKTGKGVVTLIDIPANRTIGIYVGKRYAPGCSNLPNSDYLLELGDGSFIDGSRSAKNWTSRINHQPGKSANIKIGKMGAIVSLRKIHAGEELFLDYGREYWRMRNIQPKLIRRKFKYHPDYIHLKK